MGCWTVERHLEMAKPIKKTLLEAQRAGICNDNWPFQSLYVCIYRIIEPMKKKLC